MKTDPTKYEYQAALPGQIEQLKGQGWEIIPKDNGDPLGAYMGHHVGFVPVLYLRRLFGPISGEAIPRGGLRPRVNRTAIKRLGILAGIEWRG